MKTRPKSSRSVRKKMAAKKKVTATARKKKTTLKKSVKKTTAKKKTQKAAPRKTAKKTAAKKKVTATARKKKPAAVKKPLSPKPFRSITPGTRVPSPVTRPAEGSPAAPPPGLLVGKVTHYYNHSSVAIIELDAGNLHVGDTVHIKGHTTDFAQGIESMQIEHQNIETAEAGQVIGLKVREMVREHDKVYKKE